MASDPDSEELERLIVLREQLRARNDASAAASDARIAELAARLGLAPDELGSAVAAVVAEHTGTPDAPPLLPLRGGFRIARPARFLPMIFAAMLAALVAAIGQPFVAGAGLAVAMLATAARPKRVTRLFVDPAGRLLLEHESSEPLDWGSVSKLEVRRHVPIWGTGIERDARSTLGIALELATGRRLRFARGTYFQVSPVQRPVHAVHIERFFQQCAEQSGLSIAHADRGFVAVRPGRAD